MNQTTTKTCLDCATEIPAVARKCPNCLEWQGTAEREQTLKDARQTRLATELTVWALALGISVVIVLMVLVFVYVVILRPQAEATFYSY